MSLFSDTARRVYKQQSKQQSKQLKKTKRAPGVLFVVWLRMIYPCYFSIERSSTSKMRAENGLISPASLSP